MSLCLYFVLIIFLLFSFLKSTALYTTFDEVSKLMEYLETHKMLFFTTREMLIVTHAKKPLYYRVKYSFQANFGIQYDLPSF